LSTAGGTRPLWARSGRELFYLDLTGRLITVPVTLTPAFSTGSPTVLLETLTAEHAEIAEKTPKMFLCGLGGLPPLLDMSFFELRRGSPKRLRREGGCG
jgi:hypothetical protein